FQFTGVLPGQYRIIVRGTTLSSTAATPATGTARGASGPQNVFQITGTYWSQSDVVVGDDDVSGLSMELQPALHMTGRLVFETATGTTPPNNVQMRLLENNGPSTYPTFSRLAPNGGFEITGIVPGRYTIAAVGAESGWMLKSVLVNGRD